MYVDTVFELLTNTLCFFFLIGVKSTPREMNFFRPYSSVAFGNIHSGV